MMKERWRERESVCVCVAWLCSGLKGTLELALSPTLLLQLGLLQPLLTQLTGQPILLIPQPYINKPELTIKNRHPP